MKIWGTMQSFAKCCGLLGLVPRNSGSKVVIHIKSFPRERCCQQIYIFYASFFRNLCKAVFCAKYKTPVKSNSFKILTVFKAEYLQKYNQQYRHWLEIHNTSTVKLKCTFRKKGALVVSNRPLVFDTKEYFECNFILKYRATSCSLDITWLL